MNISSLTLVSSTSSANAASGDAAQSTSLDLTSIRSAILNSKSSTDANSSDDLQERRQNALALVNRTLTAAYEKMSSRTKSATAAYEDVEPLTPTKVANNILGFIERRLQLDAADGATQEQLQSRLDAGLSGFQKGFAEASEQLKALNQLSPDIESDIGQTKDLVLKGIDDLRSKFIKATEEQPAVDASQVPVVAAPDAAVNNAPATDKAAAKPVVLSTAVAKPTAGLQLPTVLSSGVKTNAQTQSKYDYGSASDFSFELTTAEGDKVTIHATASTGKAAGSDASSGQSISFSVDGDLSDSELKAINELLGHVNDLAEQFFSGNLDDAMNQVLSLGYDKSQIGDFALSLTQVDIQVVPDSATADMKAQETAQQSSNDSSGVLPDEFYPLGNFIKNLLDSLDIPSSFDDPQKLFIDISKSMISKDDEGNVQATRFSDFVQGIFALDLNNNSNRVSNVVNDTDKGSVEI